MNYKEAREYIDGTLKFGMKLGLSNMEMILEELGNPHRKIKSIHVAGTNGKGSVTSMVSNILINSGYNVGMFTSPYIEKFEERIQINNEYIKNDELARIISRLKDVIEDLKSNGMNQPTEFEIVTCAMFMYFEEKNVDFAVIEVGLGGRYDSTNVINPILTVITSISYDHMDILGNTLEKITYEKAGIIKDNVPLVLYPQKKEVLNVIEAVSKEKHAPITYIKSDEVKFIEFKNNKQIIEIKTSVNNYKVELPLLGEHQLLNALTSVKVCEKLNDLGININHENIINGLNSVKWMGRFEIMNENPLIIIDGAHNIEGITKFKESYNEYYENSDYILVLGILKDKDVDDMVKVIGSDAKYIIATKPKNDRAGSKEEFLDVIKKYNKNFDFIEDYNEVIKRAMELSNGLNILVCGSLYLIGDMRKEIREILL